MQLRAATKQTNPNFVRVIRQKFQSNARLGSGCHKPFYRHMFVLSYMYFTDLLKLPAPPRAALCYDIYFFLCTDERERLGMCKEKPGGHHKI